MIKHLRMGLVLASVATVFSAHAKNDVGDDPNIPAYEVNIPESLNSESANYAKDSERRAKIARSGPNLSGYIPFKSNTLPELDYEYAQAKEGIDSDFKLVTDTNRQNYFAALKQKALMHRLLDKAYKDRQKYLTRKKR